LGSLLERFFSDKVHVLGESSNVKHGVSLIHKFQPQLVFLDIELRGVNGFDLLDQFEEPRSFEVVFTTAHKEHAIKAIRRGAFDYILKPISLDNLSEMLNRLEGFLSAKNKVENAAFRGTQPFHTDSKINPKLSIPVSKGYNLENKENILYCEGMINYTKIYLASGKEVVLAKTLKSMTLLLGENFFRIHKSYLVNTDYIVKYSRSDGFKITLANNTVLEVSHRNRDKLLLMMKSKSKK
jgi:two-component system LytT family response regulator